MKRTLLLEKVSTRLVLQDKSESFSRQKIKKLDTRWLLGLLGLRKSKKMQVHNIILDTRLLVQCTIMCRTFLMLIWRSWLLKLDYWRSSKLEKYCCIMLTCFYCAQTYSLPRSPKKSLKQDLVKIECLYLSQPSSVALVDTSVDKICLAKIEKQFCKNGGKNKLNCSSMSVI